MQRLFLQPVLDALQELHSSCEGLSQKEADARREADYRGITSISISPDVIETTRRHLSANIARGTTGESIRQFAKRSSAKRGLATGAPIQRENTNHESEETTNVEEERYAAWISASRQNCWD